MTVYVDAAQNAYGRMKMCHMLADTRAELDAMADRIGVARNHYQDPMRPTVSFPHYDICQSKRALAVQCGAQEIGRRELVAFMVRIKQVLITQKKTWAQTEWHTT